MEEQEFYLEVSPKKKFNIIYIIVTVLAIILGYFLYDLMSDKSAKYQKYEQTIDSLNKEVVKLDSLHIKQDSFIFVYKDSIVYLDSVIEKEKIKYVGIKNKYNEIRNSVTNYSNNELDSFFSNRYRYK